jgi:PPOX class probable F420-dependent enzyme
MLHAALLDASLHLWLTANRPDGPPHTTPLWFVHDDDALWVSVRQSSWKARLLRADPRVSLAVEGTAPLGGLVGEGTVELVAPGTRPDVTRAFAARYGGWDGADPSTDGPRVLGQVTLTRWFQEPADL